MDALLRQHFPQRVHALHQFLSFRSFFGHLLDALHVVALLDHHAQRHGDIELLLAQLEVHQLFLQVRPVLPVLLPALHRHLLASQELLHPSLSRILPVPLVLALDLEQREELVRNSAERARVHPIIRPF